MWGAASAAVVAAYPYWWLVGWLVTSERNVLRCSQPGRNPTTAGSRGGLRLLVPVFKWRHYLLLVGSCLVDALLLLTAMEVEVGGPRAVARPPWSHLPQRGQECEGRREQGWEQQHAREVCEKVCEKVCEQPQRVEQQLTCRAPNARACRTDGDVAGDTSVHDGHHIPSTSGHLRSAAGDTAACSHAIACEGVREAPEGLGPPPGCSAPPASSPPASAQGGEIEQEEWKKVKQEHNVVQYLVSCFGCGSVPDFGAYTDVTVAGGKLRDAHMDVYLSTVNELSSQLRLIVDGARRETGNVPSFDVNGHMDEILYIQEQCESEVESLVQDGSLLVGAAAVLRCREYVADAAVERTRMGYLIRKEAAAVDKLLQDDLRVALYELRCELLSVGESVKDLPDALENLRHAHTPILRAGDILDAGGCVADRVSEVYELTDSVRVIIQNVFKIKARMKPYVDALTLARGTFESVGTMMLKIKGPVADDFRLEVKRGMDYLALPNLVTFTTHGDTVYWYCSRASDVCGRAEVYKAAYEDAVHDLGCVRHRISNDLDKITDVDPDYRHGELGDGLICKLEGMLVQVKRYEETKDAEYIVGFCQEANRNLADIGPDVESVVAPWRRRKLLQQAEEACIRVQESVKSVSVDARRIPWIEGGDPMECDTLYALEPARASMVALANMGSECLFTGQYETVMQLVSMVDEWVRYVKEKAVSSVAKRDMMADKVLGVVQEMTGMACDLKKCVAEIRGELGADWESEDVDSMVDDAEGHVRTAESIEDDLALAIVEMQKQLDKVSQLSKLVDGIVKHILGMVCKHVRDNPMDSVCLSVDEMQQVKGGRGRKGSDLHGAAHDALKDMRVACRELRCGEVVRLVRVVGDSWDLFCRWVYATRAECSAARNRLASVREEAHIVQSRVSNLAEDMWDRVLANGVEAGYVDDARLDMILRSSTGGPCPVEIRVEKWEQHVRSLLEGETYLKSVSTRVEG